MTPSADDVARAIVAAARRLKEDPVAVLTSGKHSRARMVAYVALARVFPGAGRLTLAQAVGAPVPRKFIHNARAAGGLDWWSSARVAAVQAEILEGLGLAPIQSGPRDVTASVMGDPGMRA